MIDPYFKILERLKSTPLEVLLPNVIVFITLLVLGLSILINFLIYDKESQADKYKKSPVETFTMTVFAIGIYLLVISRTGVYRIETLSFISMIFGLALMIFSCIFNIIGRYNLGRNWSNQIRIKKSHSLVQTGVYKIVRHPLYASTIWMIYGAGFVYCNYTVLLANTLLFIPIMTFRAKQEEKFLSIKFEGYKTYMKNTGRFFPKLLK